MIRGTLAVLAVASLLAVGCDNNEPSSTSPEVKDAADKVAAEGANAVDKARDKAGEATDAAKDGADANQKAIDDLLAKAKEAIKDKKWPDAENLLKQAEEKKSLLPADKQPPVQTAIDEARKLINAGKNLSVPGLPGADK